MVGCWVIYALAGTEQFGAPLSRAIGLLALEQLNAPKRIHQPPDAFFAQRVLQIRRKLRNARQVHDGRLLSARFFSRLAEARRKRKCVVSDLRLTSLRNTERFLADKIVVTSSGFYTFRCELQKFKVV